MNVIKVNVNFKNRTIYKQGVDLTSGDYNSTKLVFEFDRQDGRKVFEMKDEDGNLVLVTDIVNNEVELVGKDENGNNASLFKQEGKYIFEISLYDGDSKLTSAFDYIKVKQEQVDIGGKVITPYLPIFDELVDEVQDLINQTNNLNIDIENSVLTITKKDGTTKSENVKGEKGEKGDAGSVKFIIVNELPTEDIDESAIYMKPSTNPQEKNTYDEYIYVNGDWESLGSAKVEVDLTDYVKNTDYADNSKFGVVKTNNNYGIQTENGVLYIRRATEPEIKTRHQWAPITPNNLDLALKIAMCDGVGEAWTDEEKAGAKTRMGIIDGVSDVKVNDGSIVTDGVANIPCGIPFEYSMAKFSNSTYGNWIYSGVCLDSYGNVKLPNVSDEQIINSMDGNYQIVPVLSRNIRTSVKTAMCDGKGDEWTEEEKASARARMGVSEHVTLTQAEYDALETKDENTYYNIVEE